MQKGSYTSFVCCHLFESYSLLLYLHILKLWDESRLVWCTGLGFDSHFVFVTFIFVVTVYFFKFFLPVRLQNQEEKLFDCKNIVF